MESWNTSEDYLSLIKKTTIGWKNIANQHGRTTTTTTTHPYPIPCEGGEVVPDRPLAKVKHIKSGMKIMGKGAVATTNQHWKENY